MRNSLCALVTWLLLAALAPQSQGQLVRTEPDHYGGGVGGLNSLPRSGLPDYRTPNPRSRVLLRRRRDLGDSGPPHQKLTAACRDGSFRQVIDHRYVAVLNDKVFGAGIGGGAMLYDPRRLAQPGIVYVFVGQGTTNCRVHMLGVPSAG